MLLGHVHFKKAVEFLINKQINKTKFPNLFGKIWYLLKRLINVIFITIYKHAN